jgi:hypothetical protein
MVFGSKSDFLGHRGKSDALPGNLRVDMSDNLQCIGRHCQRPDSGLCHCAHRTMSLEIAEFEGVVS